MRTTSRRNLAHVFSPGCAAILMGAIAGCHIGNGTMSLKLEGSVNESFEIEAKGGLHFVDSVASIGAEFDGEGASLMVTTGMLPHLGRMDVTQLKVHSEEADATALEIFVDKINVPDQVEQGLEVEGHVSGTVKTTAGDSKASGTFWIEGNCSPGYRSMCGEFAAAGVTTFELQPSTMEGCQEALHGAIVEGAPGNIKASYDADKAELSFTGGRLKLKCIKGDANDDGGHITRCSAETEVDYQGCTYKALVWGHKTFIGVTAIGSGGDCGDKTCTVSYWEP